MRSRSSHQTPRPLSGRYSAPVDRKCDAVDEAGIITGEEDDRRGQFLGLSDATCWCLGCGLLHHLFGDTFHHRRARRAGGNGVDPNTAGRIRRPRPSSTVRDLLGSPRTKPCRPVRSWRPSWRRDTIEPHLTRRPATRKNLSRSVQRSRRNLLLSPPHRPRAPQATRGVVDEDVDVRRLPHAPGPAPIQVPQRRTEERPTR